MPTGNDTGAISRTHVLRRVQELTGIGIEPADFAVVAGHEPQLADRWLCQAYRVAALDDLSHGFDNALEVVRDELIGGIVDHRLPDEYVDNAAAVVARIAGYTEWFEAVNRHEIAAFADPSRQIAARRVCDLIAFVPNPAETH